MFESDTKSDAWFTVENLGKKGVMQFCFIALHCVCHPSLLFRECTWSREPNKIYIFSQTKFCSSRVPIGISLYVQCNAWKHLPVRSWMTPRYITYQMANKWMTPRTPIPVHIWMTPCSSNLSIYELTPRSTNLSIYEWLRAALTYPFMNLLPEVLTTYIYMNPRSSNLSIYELTPRSSNLSVHEWLLPSPTCLYLNDSPKF